MELTILERLLLLNVLPPSGDLTTIRIVRKLRETLSFNEQELEEYQIRVGDDGQVKWRVTEDAKAIELGAKAHDIAVKALEKLDAEGAITEQHLSLFDKFGIGLD